MEKNEIKDKLLDIIEEEVPEVDKNALDTSASLSDDGLDSVSLIKVIVDAETGEKTEISCGDTSDALLYEMEDMEHAVLTCDTSGLHLNYTKDVMDIMTYLRKEWNMKYPDENWD